MDSRQGRQQVSRTVGLVGAVLISAMIAAVVIASVAMREREIEDWRRQMSSMSLILAEQTTQTVFAANLILDSVTDHVREAGITDQASFRAKLATPAMYELLRERIHGLPQVDVASIIAANGDNINFSRSYPVPPINLAERDYFKAHLANPNLGDFISQPVHNKGNGKWTFYISRRLNDARGNFMGLVLVGMSVDVFTGFFERLARNLGAGATVSLFRNDLMLLTRWPDKDEVIGTINRTGASYEVIEVMKKKEAVLLRNTPRFSTGAPELRLTAVRATERYPLVVVIVVTEDLILSSWRRSTGIIAGITTAGVLGLLFGLFTLVRILQQREFNMERMRQLIAEAEAANLAKSRFLATMSHEIRTPLNGVLGMAQLLLMPNLAESERNNYARVILTSGQTLLTLLNDILDLSKIEAGKIQIEATPFDPSQLLAETRALYSESAHSKELRLECQWHGVPGQRYRSDPHRLRQMLFNLVGNAIKFTPAGEVRVEAAEIERDGEGEGKCALLEFSVSDTGIGIPAEKLELLFLPFSQADNSTTREFGGTGLGLSIVHTLAKLMGGETGVSSTPGQGSRFWFRIRAGIVANGEDSRLADRSSVAAAAPAVAQSGAGASVLVVEDDPVNRQIIKALLGKLGLRVVLANDGQQAVDAIVAGPAPDVVLMDIQMPVMDGYAATTLIRQREAASGLPRLTIIALTANAFAEDRERCLSAGMDDFLSKPIAFDALVSMLGKWIPAESKSVAAVSDRPVDVRALARCIDEIAPLLAQNMFDAIPRFKDLQTLTSGTHLAGQIDEIEKELRLFHFPVVLERLRQIVSKLEAR